MNRAEAVAALGVRADATVEECRAAFLARAAALQPAHVASASPERQAEADAELSRITDAWLVVSEPESEADAADSPSAGAAAEPVGPAAPGRPVPLDDTASAAAAPRPTPDPAPVARRRRISGLTFLLVGVALVLIVGLLVWTLLTPQAATGVGSCWAAVDGGGVTPVECTDPSAAYTAVTVVDVVDACASGSALAVEVDGRVVCLVPR